MLSAVQQNRTELRQGTAGCQGVAPTRLDRGHHRLGIDVSRRAREHTGLAEPAERAERRVSAVAPKRIRGPLCGIIEPQERAEVPDSE